MVSVVTNLTLIDDIAVNCQRIQSMRRLMNGASIYFTMVRNKNTSCFQLKLSHQTKVADTGLLVEFSGPIVQLSHQLIQDRVPSPVTALHLGCLVDDSLGAAQTSDSLQTVNSKVALRHCP